MNFQVNKIVTKPALLRTLKEFKKLRVKKWFLKLTIDAFYLKSEWINSFYYAFTLKSDFEETLKFQALIPPLHNFCKKTAFQPDSQDQEKSEVEARTLFYLLY